MISREFTIVAELSTFIKAITYFVNTASDFSSSITIKANGRQADAKSIINIMALGIKQSTKIELSAVGNDANEAINKLEEILIEQKLI